MNEVRDLIGFTYTAANQLVDRLVEIDVLEEVTGQARNRRFRRAAYISLIGDRWSALVMSRSLIASRLIADERR